MLAQAGIRVSLNAMPKSQFFPMVNGLESDFYMLGWGVPSYDSEYIFNFLYHTRTEAYGSWNNTRYSNPELDAMIRGIAQEIDIEARDAMVAQMWETVKEDVVYIPIHHQMLNWAVRDTYALDVGPGQPGADQVLRREVSLRGARGARGAVPPARLSPVSERRCGARLRCAPCSRVP